MDLGSTELVKIFLPPFLTAIISGVIAFVDRSRSKLVWYEIPSHALELPNADGTTRYTEMATLILENRSREIIRDVVVAHNPAPGRIEFGLVEPVEMHRVDLQNGGTGLRFPAMIKRGRITLVYASSQPMGGNVISQIYSSEGVAKRLPLVMQRQYSKWQRTIIVIFCLAGIWAIVLLLTRLVLFFSSLKECCR